MQAGDMMTVGKKSLDPKLTDWPLVRTKEMVAISGLSADRLKLLRDTQLAEKVYWVRPMGSRILWNAQLVRDWLVQGDSPSHRNAVSTYQKSLPSSQ
jgi:hypothetical protein